MSDNIYVEIFLKNAPLYNFILEFSKSFGKYIFKKYFIIFIAILDEYFFCIVLNWLLLMYGNANEFYVLMLFNLVNMPNSLTNSDNYRFLWIFYVNKYAISLQIRIALPFLF